MTADHVNEGLAAGIAAHNALVDALNAYWVVAWTDGRENRSEDTSSAAGSKALGAIFAALGDLITAEIIYRAGRPAPVAISDAEVDRIAELTVKAMPDGLQGFMKVWGWQQFSRMLVDNLEPYGLRRAALPLPAVETEAEHVCAQAYQVVGSLLSDLGQFETERAQKILDNLSQAKLVHDDVLPWPSFTGHDVEKDAARWRAMRELLIAVDWAYQDDPTKAVAVFECKATEVFAGPAGADAIADAAIRAAAQAGA